MSETAEAGTVLLSFQAGELVPERTWTMFTTWFLRNYSLSGESSKLIHPGFRDEPQVSYARTFGTQPEFEQETRELVRSLQASGRLPRMVYRVDARYWLGSMDESEVHWYLSIDLYEEQIPNVK